MNISCIKIGFVRIARHEIQSTRTSLKAIGKNSDYKNDKDYTNIISILIISILIDNFNYSLGTRYQLIYFNFNKCIFKT